MAQACATRHDASPRCAICDGINYKDSVICMLLRTFLKVAEKGYPLLAITIGPPLPHIWQPSAIPVQAAADSRPMVCRMCDGAFGGGLGPRMLAHAAPISSFTCFAGGESPPLSGSFPPRIVKFDTVYVIHKLYGSYWLVFEVMFMVHHQYRNNRKYE